MLVKSEHYSDYKIRTFNVKRVGSSFNYFHSKFSLHWFSLSRESLFRAFVVLCHWRIKATRKSLILSNKFYIFIRKVKRRREKWNSFISPCGLIMAFLNIPLLYWPSGDESELITRLMLDHLSCTAGLILIFFILGTPHRNGVVAYDMFVSLFVCFVCFSLSEVGDARNSWWSHSFAG